MITLPLSKSTWQRGRLGPIKLQDYYRIVKISVDSVRSGKTDKALLISEFHPKNIPKSELDLMIEIALKEGLSPDDMYTKCIGYDTLSQIKFAIHFCEDVNTELQIVSCLLHYPRVRWIANRVNKNKIKIEHTLALGIPRFSDVISDIILLISYPIIDLLGYSERFSLYIKSRRDAGIL